MGPKETRVGRRSEAAGFTLIELLVVVVIIGLLAGFVAPRYFSQVGKSEVAVAKAQIDALGKALDTYRLDTGHYPSSELGLSALVERPSSEPKWAGPYLRKDVPLDPWGSRTCTRYRARRATSTSSPTARTDSRAGPGKTPTWRTTRSGMRYELKAIAPDGTIEAVDFHASDQTAAVRSIEARGYTVLSVRAKRALGLPWRLPQQRFPVALFSQELRTLVGAGLPLLEAIETLAQKEKRDESRAILLRIAGLLREGLPLSIALEEFPQAFSPLYIATIKAAEKTSDLAPALARYVAYAGQVEAVRKRIVNASIYPALLVTDIRKPVYATSQAYQIELIVSPNPCVVLSVIVLMKGGFLVVVLPGKSSRQRERAKP